MRPYDEIKKHFKDFLSKQTMESIPRRYRLLFPTIERYISVKSLGEWAWKELLDSDENYFESLPEPCDLKSWEVKDVFGFYEKTICSGDCIYWDIAVACLFEPEIKKRLKELKK